MQTLIPLYAFIEYYTDRMYEDKRFTYSLFNEFGTHAAKELESLYRQVNSADLSEDDHTVLSGEIQANINKLGYDIAYAFSRLIIEEPEQSLFPQAQIELVYDMVNKITSSKYSDCTDDDLSVYPHDLFVTTHSQYLLYALNNCMLSYITKEAREVEGELDNTLQRYINPEDVNIYQIEDGTLKSYRSESGLLGRNYFNDNMKAIMKDFSDMIDYYGED